MADLPNQNRRRNQWFSPTRVEKIFLALIPVLGTVIVAYFQFRDNSKTTNIAAVSGESRTVELKKKAGTINQMVVYRRYDDMVPLMNVGVRPLLTRKVFDTAMDSTTKNLGKFVNPIDTTLTEISNNQTCFIRNQYENGETVVQIMFDKQEQIFGLWTIKK